MPLTRTITWTDGPGGGTPLSASRLNAAFQEPADYADTAIAARASDYVQASGGGREAINTIASSGSAVTLDLSLGNVQDVTLTAATVTVTLTGQVASKACSMTVFVRQDGVGGRLAIWPGSVLWPSGNVPLLSTTPSACDVINLVTLDGGTTWLGFHGTTTPWEADPTLAMDNAVETEDRLAGVLAATVVGPSNGTIHLSYFRARRTLAISKIGVMVGGTAAAATPTLARFGFYTVASSGALALGCETDNIATGGCTETNQSGTTTAGVRFGASTFSEYVAPLSSAHLGLPTSYTFATGQLYALGIVIMTSVAVPTYYGNGAITKSSGVRWPRVCGLVSGQTDLLASISTASIGATTSHICGYGLA